MKSPISCMMFHVDRSTRCLSLQKFLYVLIIIVEIESTKICRIDRLTYLYPVHFSGPYFNQSVYSVKASIQTLNNGIDKEILTFSVEPQRKDIWSRNLNENGIQHVTFNETYDNIDVICTNNKFLVKKLRNGLFSLCTATSDFDYFVPFHRYIFDLIAEQYVPNRPILASRATVEIHLLNENARSPKFLRGHETFYVSETAKVGTEIGTIYAIDPDNDPISYSMTSLQFSIDSNSGVIRLEQPFHSKSASNYSLNVTICDSRSAFPSSFCQNSVTKTIDIVLITVNKQSPRFIHPECGSDLNLEENSPINSIVARFEVFDDDRAENGRISISFPSEESRTTLTGFKNNAYSQFYLEQNEQNDAVRYATLRANQTFDYDAPGSNRVWHLFLLATDHGRQARQSFCTFRVTLVDVNDNAPVFIMPIWNYTVYQSTNPLRNEILRLIASDADSGLFGEVNYFIETSGVPYLILDQKSGILKFQSHIRDSSQLDAKRFPIVFKVYAKDSGKPSLVSQQNATVIINFLPGTQLSTAHWVNPRYEQLNLSISEKFYEKYQNRPIFDLRSNFDGSIIYRLPLSESSLMTVNCPYPYGNSIPFRDAPIVKNGQIYSGGIILTGGLHCEIQDEYFLIIRVLSRPPLIGTVRINLIDENDQIPTFDIRPAILTVMELESGHRVLGKIQAFDRDIDSRHNRIIYSLNDRLTDAETSGKIFVSIDGNVWTNRTFSRETDKSFYRIFVRASDNSAAWNSQSVPNFQDFQIDIQILSINAKAPVFKEKSNLNLIIDETTEKGEVIRNITIIDEDLETVFNLGILNGNFRNAFSFTLLNENSSCSQENVQCQTVGQLKVVSTLSCEVTPTYRLVLFVSDSQNVERLEVIVTLRCHNTKAPEFQSSLFPLVCPNEPNRSNGIVEFFWPTIEALDPDQPSTKLFYEIEDPNNLLNVENIQLRINENRLTLSAKLEDLFFDIPIGLEIYTFNIRVTDENGQGVSSSLSACIEMKYFYDDGPILLAPGGNFLEGKLNPNVSLEFDSRKLYPSERFLPYDVELVDSPLFTLIPKRTFDRRLTLVYNGIFNRTENRSTAVTIRATDKTMKSKTSRISIVIGDRRDSSAISDGKKSISIVAIEDFSKSLTNVELGSVFVENLDDWFREENQYSIAANSIFYVERSFLKSKEELVLPFYNVRVDVLKPTNPNSRATSSINIDLTQVDIESAQQAVLIRVEGDFAEKFIDSIEQIRSSLASTLSISTVGVRVLAIRRAFVYRHIFDLPLPEDEARRKTLVDIYVSVTTIARFPLEIELNENIFLLQSTFPGRINSIGTDLCYQYRCSSGTFCRQVRTFQNNGLLVDANRTSFVAIDLQDHPLCVHSETTVQPLEPPPSSFVLSNNQTYVRCPVDESLGARARFCQVLGRVFDQTLGGFAEFNVEQFSISEPTFFSFDFFAENVDMNTLILFYGRTILPIDEHHWLAIDIFNSRLRFHFGNDSFTLEDFVLESSRWFHVECQLIDSMAIISINDCKYRFVIDLVSKHNDLRFVKFYLGGLSRVDTLVLSIYPILKDLSRFRGSIRNFHSDGIHLDMSKTISSENSYPGIRRSRVSMLRQLTVPWYTWLILTLVSLIMASILILSILMLIRRQNKFRVTVPLYIDDVRDNIIDYKETAGELDHHSYDLNVLRKAKAGHFNNEMMIHSVESSAPNSKLSREQRTTLEYHINHRLNQQSQKALHADDTCLRYRHEGESWNLGDLSSVDSTSLNEESLSQMIRSLGPRFSILADLYSEDNLNSTEDFHR